MQRMQRIHPLSLVAGGVAGVLLGYLAALALAPEEPRPVVLAGKAEGPATLLPRASQPRESPAKDRTGARRALAQESEISEASDADPGALLDSNRRVDQARAIELLLAAGTTEAMDELLERFLGTDDPILAALMEEALLAAPIDMTPALSAAFAASSDWGQSERLASVLLKLAQARPAIEADVVDLFVASLAGAGAGLVPARNALARIGPGALGSVADVLVDPHASEDAAAAAAWVLSQSDGAHADAVRLELRDSIAAALGEVDGGNLTPEQVRGMREKTQWLAWSATNRPADEHDQLVGLFADSLGGVHDPTQAQALAWGIGNLRGLSEEARTATAGSLFGALATAHGPEVRQSHIWAVAHVAAPADADTLGPSFHAIKGQLDLELRRHEGDAEVLQHLIWLQHHLAAEEEKRGR